MNRVGEFGARRMWLAVMLLPWALSLAGTGWCSDNEEPKGSVEKQAKSSGQSKEQQPPRVLMPKFVPPKRGAPVGRIAGGARGKAEGVPVLVALTPEHVALTAKQSPTVYWYLSEVTPWPVELTVTEPRAETPLLVRRLPQPEGVGIQSVRLEELGGQLEPDRDYHWYIALVRDAQSRSRDLLAWGGVRWERPSGELLTDVERAAPSDVPARYAAAGYWYEALDAAIRLSKASPYSDGGTAARDSLLAQVGLGELVSNSGSE